MDSTFFPDAQLAPELTLIEIRALNAAACAADAFEPFVGWLVEKKVLDRLVESGLLEAGPSCRPSVGQIGYRLTIKGRRRWKRRLS